MFRKLSVKANDPIENIAKLLLYLDLFDKLDEQKNQDVSKEETGLVLVSFNNKNDLSKFQIQFPVDLKEYGDLPESEIEVYVTRNRQKAQRIKEIYRNKISELGLSFKRWTNYKDVAHRIEYVFLDIDISQLLNKLSLMQTVPKQLENAKILVSRFCKETIPSDETIPTACSPVLRLNRF